MDQESHLLVNTRSILERRYGLKSKILWLRNNHYFTKLPLLLSKIMGHTHYDIYDGYRVIIILFKNYLVKGSIFYAD